MPTSSDDWLAPLERPAGVAPDLPGFGRSGKAGNVDYSLRGYADFVERFLDALELARVALVGHGWGAAIALVFAQRLPSGSAGWRSSTPSRCSTASAGRRCRVVAAPGIGELMMGSTNRWLLARRLRAGAATPDAWPDARIDAVWEQFDQGTQRAILRLYRSARPPALARPAPNWVSCGAPALVSGASGTRGWRRPSPTPTAAGCRGDGAAHRRGRPLAVAGCARGDRPARRLRRRHRADVTTAVEPEPVDPPRAHDRPWIRLAPTRSPRSWPRPT